MSITITPVDKELVAAVVAAIINETGSPIQLVVSLGLQLCTTCGGLDPFCPTCAGNKYTHIEETITKIGLVRWKKEDKRKYRPEGQYLEGDCVVAFIYEDADTTQSGTAFMGTEYIARRTKYVLLDDKRLVVDSYYRQGKQTNRVYFVCNEEGLTSEPQRIT